MQKKVCSIDGSACTKRKGESIVDGIFIVDFYCLLCYNADDHSVRLDRATYEPKCCYSKST